MDLRLDILRPEAARLFEKLRNAQELSQLTLMGGTALALQIGHRISLDFDFATFGVTLPMAQLDALIARLKQQGSQAQLITSPEQTSVFKINTGLNLLNYARDYVVDGVKVTFFVHGKNEVQKGFYRDAPKISESDTAFAIMGLEGLKTAKTLVLADRVRSRDLYDLYVLNKDFGWTMTALLETATQLGTLDDPEHYKAVLRGVIPVDRDDEGLMAVAADAELSTIYNYFDQAIGDYEIQRAKDYFSEGGDRRRLGAAKG